MQINIHNFHQCSVGEFKEELTPTTPPNFTSKESQYWYFELQGFDYIIIRRSNHWGNVLNCRWTLNTLLQKDEFKTGCILLSSLKFNKAALNHLKKHLKKLPLELIEKLFLEVKADKHLEKENE